MRTSIFVLPAVVVAALVLGAISSQPTVADAKYQSIASVEQLMSGLVKPQNVEIRKALRGSPDEKTWHKIEAQAAVLAEAGQLLQMGKRAKKDSVWVEAATRLTQSSAAVLAAAEKKDAKAAMAAVKGIGSSCGQCHKKFKD